MSEHDEPKTALTRLLGEHSGVNSAAGWKGSPNPQDWRNIRRVCSCNEPIGGSTFQGNGPLSGYPFDEAHRAHLADVLLAEGYTTSPAPEATETVEHLQARLDDETAARRIAGGAADRFRDVLSECLGHADENPGDDVLVTELRQHFGKTGPEPTRWRNFLTGARAVMDQINAMPDPWVPVDRAADEHEEGGR